MLTPEPDLLVPRLRPLDRSDLPTLHRWWNDPELWGQLGSRRHLTMLDETESWFEALLQRTDVTEGRTFGLSVPVPSPKFTSLRGRKPVSSQAESDVEATKASMEGERLIGTAWYGSFDPIDRNTEIGLYLGESSDRGHGLGTMACKALVTYLFNDLGVNKARLLAAVENAAAIACYEKIGFRQEGLLRQHRFFCGKFHDFVAMGLLAQEYGG